MVRSHLVVQSLVVHNLVQGSKVVGMLEDSSLDMLEDMVLGMVLGSTVLVGMAVGSKDHSSLMSSLSAQSLLLPMQM
jgi:hypothetical protein